MDTGARFVVLAAVDDSNDAPAIVSRAAHLVAGYAKGELHIMHAYARGRYADNAPLGTFLESVLAEARERLDKLAATARPLHGGPITTHVVDGDPAPTILRVASSLDADVIVVGTHGRKGLERIVLGSVAETVVRGAPCPVFVVRPKAHQEPVSPEIEPPCPACLLVQKESQGSAMWCARHSTHRPTAHRHYSYPPSFGQGSQLIRP